MQQSTNLPQAVFLDRDGTLVRDVGYVHRIADYARLPGVLEGLSLLHEAGYRLIVLTNQSGMARGFYGEPEFWAFQAHLERDLSQHGIALTASYFCPHLPEAGCSCRKPAPGLVQRAQQEWNLDLAHSWVVGDRSSDVELAARANLRGAVWISDAAEPSEPLPPSAVRATNLEQAAQHILQVDRS